MKIHDIDSYLASLKTSCLGLLDLPVEVADSIPLGDTPSPEHGYRGFPVFTLAKMLRMSPAQIAEKGVAALNPSLEGHPLVARVTAEGGYVNFHLHPSMLASVVLGQVLEEGDGFGAKPFEPDQGGQSWVLEFSSPNTNKPQHLGHVRNNLLGSAVANLLQAGGDAVRRAVLINDRGIHICKSMLAYKLWGKGETPTSTGEKGDHLVGRYYVRFDQELQKELKGADLNPHEADSAVFFNTHSNLGAQARQMLVDWEAGKPEVRELWSLMNGWVLDGFDKTYTRLGVPPFDNYYYESKTYLLGKKCVREGLEGGVFHQDNQGKAVVDLAQIGMVGQKVLLREDGTSVYLTQDLGAAFLRADQHPHHRLLYVTGNEQDRHFQVLFGLLGLLRPSLDGCCEHLSYGMVELPEGRMKSREGTVVDADNLMDELEALAAAELEARHPELEAEEREARAAVIGLAALKYYMLDFNPRTTVHFDPKKSLEFTGRTGPYVLYTYARIQSLGKGAGMTPLHVKAAAEALTSPLEGKVVHQLGEWPRTLAVAIRDRDPSKLTEYLFNLCKVFNLLYNDQDHRIKPMTEGPRKQGLLLLAQAVGVSISAGLNILEIPKLEVM